MKLADQPDWVQKVYWYFHGPVVNRQPRPEGYVNMSGEAIVRFLMIEALLIIVMLFVAWAISKTDWDGQAKRYITWIVYVLFGGAAIIVLFRFVGVM